MAKIEVNLRFIAIDGAVISGLLEWLEEVREKEGISTVSIHVRYVEG